MAQATLSCPDQGAILVDEEWRSAYGVESLVNRGPCALRLYGIDAAGNILEPHETLASGGSLAKFQPPAGTKEIWALCDAGCEGETTLDYVIPGQS